MRALTVLFSIFIVLSLFGCGENPVNPSDSIPNPEINKDLQAGSGIIKDEIPICCQAFDPVTGECSITGKVTYMHQILEYTTDSVRVKINLEMDSELCTKLMHPMQYEIYGSSEDIEFVKVNGKILIDKTYEISYRTDIILCVQYLVTTEAVSIMEMNLIPLVNADH